MTGDLVISEATPSITLHDTSEVADARRYRIQNDTGAIRVQAVSDADGVQATPLLIRRSSNRVEMTGATRVIVPAATTASDAAQVTAIDSVTGRLAIGGREVGDTGWRDVTADLTNGWTATEVLIRRVGAQVEMAFTALNGSAATSINLYTIPTGFRLDRGTAPTQTASRPRILLSDSGNGGGGTLTVLNVAGTSGELVRGLTAAIAVPNFGAGGGFTQDAWPATLPGVAA